MKTVFLLIAIYSNDGHRINIETAVFKDAARCIRNKESNEKELAKSYKTVSVQCQSKELLDGK